MNLRGPLRYLIGADGNPQGEDGCVTECNYDADRPALRGPSIKYGNLFFEKFAEASASTRARFAPYRHDSDTAEQYDEGEIDPRGPGWTRNIDEQIARAKAQGFLCMEWDNPDAYGVNIAIRAIERAWGSGLHAVAKNPILVEGDHTAYMAHPAIAGAVVERGAGTCNQMHQLRTAAGKPLLPVWFVAFGRGWRWAKDRAAVIKANNFRNMGVTYSHHGEYTDADDVLRPIEA